MSIFTQSANITLRKCDPYIFQIEVRTFAPQTNLSTCHDGCVEWTSCPYPTTKTQTTMAEKFIICVSQQQVLLDKRRADYREDNIWPSITDQLGYANGEKHYLV